MTKKNYRIFYCDIRKKKEKEMLINYVFAGRYIQRNSPAGNGHENSP